ncbi:F-box/kelch-repeat protein SKIP11-like isoform X2 [Salvia hispanica]|uniref:F-box/kelch-repeat protein SKIP11-like isoform X2 n=1 Tax=Salvia hispanica TaxID=49212 RepID=UPI002009766E|nr:F-box/kelch-repeat protein SKIP11-like isoform X2 [Salvia hispanica]
MLENRACLVSRDYSRSCERNASWPFVSLRLEKAEIPQTKRPLSDINRGEEIEVGVVKFPKLSTDQMDSTSPIGGMVNAALAQSASEPRSRRHADKESLAVGTELLVFGRDLMSHVIYRYSLLTNTWTTGMRMNAPRCLFGSASLGEIAILAGGCDLNGSVLKSAELYNSESGTWTTLPSMHKPRKMCSGVFLDGKFYVVGGIGGADNALLTCGEEYDLATQTWTEIPNMSPVRTGAARDNEPPVTSEAPPLIAVVNNQLYAADYADMEVRKYDKENKMWVTVGRLPERADSMYGWGLAFRACGDRLMVIGGPRNAGEGFIEVNSWIPSEGPPEWHLLDRKRSGSFVYNCAVMGC